MAKSVLYFTEVCLVGVAEFFNHALSFRSFVCVSLLRKRRDLEPKCVPQLFLG